LDTQNGGSWGSYFIQTADIDASSTSTWDSNQGFSPIGNLTSQFSGSYDGQRNKIIGLNINRPSANYVALFGYTLALQSKCHTCNVNITGNNNVGGLNWHA